MSPRPSLESHRPALFLLGVVVGLSVLLAALEWTDQPPAGAADQLDADALLDALTLEPDDRLDMISAPEGHKTQPKALTDKLEVVDTRLADEPLEQSAVSGDDPDAEQRAPQSTPADLQADVREESPAQQQAMNDRQKELQRDVVKKLPEFPGGWSALMTWLTRNLRYPAEAQRRKIEGEVVVTFIVGTDGRLSDFRVATPAHTLLNQEALRVMRLMPPWAPGIDRGRPIRTMMAVPVVFDL